MNINRDYLIINDVKKSNVKLDNGSIFFYITDKNTQNIFVNLVINVSNNDLIQKYANIENAEDYTLTMNIVKPDNTYKIIEGKLHDKEKAIFEFNLNEDCCDEIGTYRCELLTKCNINGNEEITTSNKLTYKVKSSILNNLDDIVEAPEYPLVIQLFDKLSDIEQYEEDRRANELARQLAEQQRQQRFNELDSDMVDRITAMDDKMVDVENRVSAKEQAVDKLITDTKADINEYKVAKDQEIDEYKSAKDTEINNAITNQDNKIDTAINAQNDRITVVENNVVAQDNRLDVLENKDVLHESRLDAIEVKNTQQDNRLDIVENKNAQQDNRLNAVEAKNVEQDNRLDDIEAIDVAQNSRLDAIEVKNQQQDDRLLDIEKVNKRQDMNLKCLFAESKNNMIDVTEEGNSIYLQNSTVGYTLIDEIQGNTMVNCNKEPDKEIILNGNINTQGYSNVTLTEGVDGGLVDVALEGNTLVNVSKTKDSTALPLEEELTYLYANTQYVVQFIADKAISIDITLGGTQLLAQSIVAGLNRVSITTPETLANNKLVIDGVGANISEVVVTDTDRKFGYFEGMKSVGECEDLEVVSSTNNTAIKNIETYGITLPNELSDTFINGVYTKNVGKFIVNEKTDFIARPITGSTNTFRYSIKITGMKVRANNNSPINSLGDTLPYLWSDQDTIHYKVGVAPETLFVYIPMEYKDKPNEYFKENPFTLYYELSTPIEFKLNKKQISMNEPLRAVGDTKDKYVLIDGKWYIERNCEEVILDGSEDENWIFPSTQPEKTNRFLLLGIPDNGKSQSKCLANTLACKKNVGSDMVGIWVDTNTIINTSIDTVDKLKIWLQQNPTTAIYQLATPTYEPIDYNPFEVYSDITHISNNSTIPCNMTIKNTGFNCLLKPSTTYTVSSNLGLNTVTTPSTLTEDCLRFMDTDTSDVTTMKNVMVLEGDYTTGKPIPSHFSGIESAFEQEYDEIVGKYKVKVRVQNEDASKENYIEFYIDEPLRGIGDVKDKVYVKNDKVVVERNCGSVTFDGSDDERWEVYKRSSSVTFINTIAFHSGFKMNNTNESENVDLRCNLVPNLNHYGTDLEGIFEKQNFRVSINKGKLSSLDVYGWKEYLSKNNMVVVYLLETPTYEEVEYNDTKLFIESFKNSTLFYNSNIPVTSKLYYSYSVPIVDTVAQTASISDEQDIMIIDLATQVAVMEMMLM